jgi:sugar lactone lactonase YvrE
MRKLIGLMLVLGCGAAQASSLVWSDSAAGTISTSNLDGSAATTVVAGLDSPQGITVLGSNLYWADKNGSIYRSNLDGSNVTTLYSDANTVARDIAVTDSAIFWATTLDDGIWRSNLDGSGATRIVSSALIFPNGITVSDDQLYWSDSGTQSIWRSNLDGTSAQAIVSGQPDTHLIGDVWITDSHVYWTTRDLALTRGGDPVDGTIQRADLNGSNQTTLVTGLVFPQQLVTDGSHIYWVDQKTAKIQRADLDGNNVSDLVVGLNVPDGIALSPAVVPIPAAAWLFGSGLALLGWVNRAGRKA